MHEVISKVLASVFFFFIIIFDAFLNKLCLIGVKKNIVKERGKVCSHRNADDLSRKVPSELDKYVIDK